MSCNALTRPPGSHFGPTGPPWHLERSGGKVVLIHSAFYDDRPRGGKLPTVHLLSIGDMNDNSSLYCYVWYPGLEVPYVTKAKLFRISFSHKNPEELKQYLNSTIFLWSTLYHAHLQPIRSFQLISLSQQNIVRPLIY